VADLEEVRGAVAAQSSQLLIGQLRGGGRRLGRIRHVRERSPAPQRTWWRQRIRQSSCMANRAGMGRRAAGAAASAAGRAGRAGSRALTTALGGHERTRVILLLASTPALASADTATVGASAIQLRDDLHITNTDVGLLVTVTSLVAAAVSLPVGVLADRVTRTRLLGAAIVLWGAAMIWSASVSTFGHLVLARVFLGGV